jgi:hypothetical protein
MKIATAFIAVLIAIGTQAQSVFGDESHAFVLMPSEAISSGVVSNVSISNSGRLLLFQRKLVTLVEIVSQAKPNWYCYDRVSKTTTKLSIPSTSFVSVMCDDMHLVFSSSRPNEGSGIMNLKTGESLPISIGNGYLIYDGSKPFAPFVMFGDRTGDVTLMTADGKANVVNFGKNVAVTGPVASDIENIYFHSLVAHANPRVALRLTMNRSSGKVTQKPYQGNEEAKDLNNYFNETHFHVNLYGEDAKISFRSEPPVIPTNIPKEIKIGPGFGGVQLSPQNDFVAYIDAGSLLLREIRPIDLALGKALSDEEERLRLIARAKQAGTAILMWSADHDDNYPGQYGLESELQPYLSTKDGLKDFTYTYKGGNASTLESPATTELGFFVATGGRVVVYADSHVKFVPNP